MSDGERVGFTQEDLDRWQHMVNLASVSAGQACYLRYDRDVMRYGLIDEDRSARVRAIHRILCPCVVCGDRVLPLDERATVADIIAFLVEGALQEG